MQLERHQFSVVFAILAICTISAHAQRSPETRGEDLVSRHCAMCHAIGRSGTSPDSKAPPFRMLGQRVPLESLQEPLGRGLLSGHPEMPEFAFPQQDIGAILRYLRSIQER
jgi:mono/diheme cytochrome c family protein